MTVYKARSGKYLVPVSLGMEILLSMHVPGVQRRMVTLSCAFL